MLKHIALILLTSIDLIDCITTLGSFLVSICSHELKSLFTETLLGSKKSDLFRYSSAYSTKRKRKIQRKCTWRCLGGDDEQIQALKEEVADEVPAEDHKGHHSVEVATLLGEGEINRGEKLEMGKADQEVGGIKAVLPEVVPLTYLRLCLL